MSSAEATITSADQRRSSRLAAAETAGTRSDLPSRKIAHDRIDVLDMHVSGYDVMHLEER